jgi:2-dehydropantoate 2-reductase
VNLPATHLVPGRVEAEGAPLSGILQLGRYPRGIDDVDADVVADLQASGFDAASREDVMAWKRAKLLRNLGNALEVLCRGTGDTHEADRDRLDEVGRRAIHEALECFAAAGMTVIDAAEYGAYVGDQAKAMPIAGRRRQGGSTWQSVARGQGSVETDYLNGEIVRIGRLYGVATPVNENIQARMRAAIRPGVQVQRVDPAELLR